MTGFEFSDYNKRTYKLWRVPQKQHLISPEVFRDLILESGFEPVDEVELIHIGKFLEKENNALFSDSTDLIMSLTSLDPNDLNRLMIPCLTFTKGVLSGVSMGRSDEYLPEGVYLTKSVKNTPFTKNDGSVFFYQQMKRHKETQLEVDYLKIIYRQIQEIEDSNRKKN